MAEKKFQIQNDGTAVLQDDLNTLGETAGLADDRVFAELFRMTGKVGSTVTKGILPSNTYTQPLLKAAGATGGIDVGPFRAMVGSRTVEATNAKLNHRDIRSGLSIADGTTTRVEFVSFAPNASGNSRWDAVYAVVAVDTDAATVVRKVKSPTTGVVADASVVVTKETLVTIGTTAGTAAASPTFPVIPSDTSTTFYIPLGYVRIPTGFTGGSTVLPRDIATTANCIKVAREVGATPSGFATSNTDVTSTIAQTWGPSGGRPDKIIAATASGGETLWVGLAMASATLGAHSHANGDVVDSRDWRGRLCSFTVSVSGATYDAPWSRSISGLGVANTAVSGESLALSTANASNSVGMGQSINANMNAVVANAARIAQVTAADFDAIDAGATVALYVDMTTGALKLYKSANPACNVVFKLDWSAPIDNVR